ncbi:glycerol-3-phosphate 1-O-acyltransferase PlsY [Aneurinibacillus terranovensis]|uniref:glycerol-3-phosphate 1-O-acyltransferase PlsY n=1 Tax=Aneurinibacillus terranovensis TaxID=278991 RepID=UPI0004248AEC|nr:glycerol-3-phosphate 1-O-acyltransferase PlsY [Aneurinibacillus terranovensis]
MGVLIILVGYLLGSISFSIVVAKRIRNIDIRDYGSGNAGATNTLRVLGKGPAILVLLLDAAKGAAAVWIAHIFGAGNWVVVLAGVASIIGHNWPVFFKFHGGKGVATTIGMLLALAPIPALLSVIVTVVIIALTRYVSLGSLVFVTLMPIMMYIWNNPAPYIIGTLLITILGYVRHYENIMRLLQGKERKIGK